LASRSTGGWNVFQRSRTCLREERSVLTEGPRATHQATGGLVVGVFAGKRARIISPTTFRQSTSKKPNRPGYPFSRAISIPQDKNATIKPTSRANPKPVCKAETKSRPLTKETKVPIDNPKTRASPVRFQVFMRIVLHR